MITPRGWVVLGEGVCVEFFAGMTIFFLLNFLSRMSHITSQTVRTAAFPDYDPQQPRQLSKEEMAYLEKYFDKVVKQKVLVISKRGELTRRFFLLLRLFRSAKHIIFIQTFLFMPSQIFLSFQSNFAFKLLF